jgi:phospholipase C
MRACQPSSWGEEPLSYTNTAYANITNNTGVTLKSVTLHHQYSDDPDESMTWSNVMPGATASPSLTVGYNTGFLRFGQDYWWAQYTLPDDSKWVSPGYITETLHGGDQGTTKTFTITGSILTDWLGSDMQLHMDKLPEYNSWAAIVLRNKFPVRLAAIVRHKYSSDSDYTNVWSPIEPDATTPANLAFIVYFNTGLIRTGSDYWNITAYLSIPPYDNAPAAAFKPFPNATTDLGCMLRASDNGKTHTFTLDGAGVRLGIASGACTDQWTTWNGYNTLAFVRIKNDFASAISTAVLTHQYSGDATWKQTRALIPAGGSSSWMVTECNTGFLRTGMDYWNVYVYLEDGTWYQNHKSDKECMISTTDALHPSTFSVSSTTFTLDLASGSCTDSMDDKGTFAPSHGRDVTLPYNQNAYIGSHNAYANFGTGFWYAQQTSSVATQLAMGATTLLMDIWYSNGDVYLLHEGIASAQPFCEPQKLSDALLTIKQYLELQSRDPVTVIFEDRVDAAHQNLIKQAFVTSGTWDMTFNPDTHNVAQNGWPTLAGFFTLTRPLIVLTSNNASPDFAYQWAYMSENVHGDPSLDTTTWLDPRSQSQPLDQLPLCALNHFPKWTVSSFKLTTWLNRAETDNAAALLRTMVDACDTRWMRYPNYVNADFWEIPTDALVNTTVYLNAMLQGVGLPVLRIQNGRAILTEIDHSRLLRGNWARETGWIDSHFAEICPPLDPDRPGPLIHQLNDAVNLTLVVATVNSVLPPGESAVRSWIGKTTGELVRYLLDIEPTVLKALITDATGSDELCAIPYLLIERAAGIAFEVTGIARRRVQAAPSAAGHDRLLLAGLAGQEGADAALAGQLTATGAELHAPSASRMYDLTHEILYLHHISAGTPTAPLIARLEKLLAEVILSNQDLGAELLSCYWIAGGAVGAASRAATERLKAFSEAQPSDCQTGRDGECRCPRFKEQIHNRLTMVLGLGTTLAIAGEILNENHDVGPKPPSLATSTSSPTITR